MISHYLAFSSSPGNQKNIFLKFQVNKWKDIFNPKRKAGQGIEKDDKKKPKRDQSDPNLCLVCGHRLARGTKSYKERHWNQKHANYKSSNPNASFQTMIVPENNQKAREYLQQQSAAVAPSIQGKGRPIADQREKSSLDMNINEDELSLTDEMDFDDIRPIRPISPSSPLEADANQGEQDEFPAINADEIAPLPPSSDSSFISASYEVHSTNPDLSAYAKPKPSAPRVNSKQETVQSLVTGYFQTVTEKAPEAFSFEKFQDDLNKILLKVDALSLESRTDRAQANTESVDSCDIKAAKNLLELSGSPNVDVEMLKDGCKVICIPCREFINGNPFMNM